LAGARHLRWMSTVTTSIVMNGLFTKVAPFLADGNNWMDIMYIRQLLVDKPFEAAHGQNMKAWNNTAFYLSKAVDPNGNLIFGDAGCNGRQLKARFQERMTFMKRLEHHIPFDLGCDNQDPSAELQLVLEDLLEMHSAITNNTASVTHHKRLVGSGKRRILKSFEVLQCARCQQRIFATSRQTRGHLLL
jgi:hypothetical protein